VEIDPEATEKLQVTMVDFQHALQNDVKPVSFSCHHGVVSQSLMANRSLLEIHFSPTFKTNQIPSLMFDYCCNGNRVRLVSV